jgi:hypothetical protein
LVAITPRTSDGRDGLFPMFGKYFSRGKGVVVYVAPKEHFTLKAFDDLRDVLAWSDTGSVECSRSELRREEFQRRLVG